MRSMENIAKWVREKRKEKKWTQQHLALKLRVTRQSVNSWENGKTRIPSPVIALLEKVFSEE